MRFRVVPHHVRPGVEVVEVFADDGRFIASITSGTHDRMIHIVSKYGRETKMLLTHPPLAQVLLGRPNEPSEQWKADCTREYGKVLWGDKGHWCPAWDNLPIDETRKEFETCVCFKAYERTVQS